MVCDYHHPSDDDEEPEQDIEDPAQFCSLSTDAPRNRHPFSGTAVSNSGFRVLVAEVEDLRG